MSSDKEKNMGSLGERLKHERNNRGVTQKELADIGGVSSKTQGKYERNETPPDTDYLNKVAESGVDVQYVITGVKAKPVTPLFDADGNTVDLGEHSTEEFAAAMLLVLAAAEELSLKVNKDQILVLANYALEQDCNKDDIKAWIKTTYAMAGVDLPNE